MKKSLILLVAFVLITSFALSACSNIRADSEQTYFDGSVLVKYQQFSSNVNDMMSFTFYDPGKYHIAFKWTPGKSSPLGRGPEYMPKDRDVTIKKSPRTILVSQYILPDYITVTITNSSGQVESHDFQ